MSVHLTIGGVNVTTADSGVELEITTSPDRPVTERRMSNGDLMALFPAYAHKARVEVSGRGRYPPALDSIDWTTAQTWTWSRHTSTGKVTVSKSIKSAGPTERGQPGQVVTRWSLSGREV